MKAHERLWKAMNHEEADRVPTFSQTIEPQFIQNYDDECEIKGESSIPMVDLVVAKEIGLDSKWVHWGGHVAVDTQPEIPTDLQNKLYNRKLGNAGHLYETNDRGETWYVDGILKTPELLKDWISYVKSFTPKEDKQYQSFFEIWKQACEDDIVPIPTAGGPFYTSWASIGMDRLGYMMRKHPQLVKDLIMAWTNLTIEEHKCFFEKGIDMMFICDDHAFKDRVMINPKQFEEFVEPAYKLMCDNAHKYGAKFIVHTDGDYSEEFPSLIRAGVDAVEPLEYESGMRLKPLKEKYGDKLTLIGNIPSSDALSVGTVEETIKITKKCILDAAEGGGYILAPGSNIIGSAKVKNVLAMIATVKKFGTYPIDRSILS